MNTDRFEACILCGCIGDAWGSSYENEISYDDTATFYWAKKPQKQREWRITDDTQLTLATCEVLNNGAFHPQSLAEKFLEYYHRGKLSGLGAATLKSILDFEAGIHFLQIGRSGEYAAGNGAAMRISPSAFFPSYSREDIYSACRITHRNDEAYTGALAVYFSIKAILNNELNENHNLFDAIIPKLPDTNVRDRLIEINSMIGPKTISDISKLGNNGYVVNSVPFAIFAASKVSEIGLHQMLAEVIEAGGDTDTNASMAGQIAGTFLGTAGIPEDLLEKLKTLRVYDWIQTTINHTKSLIK